MSVREGVLAMSLEMTLLKRVEEIEKTLEHKLDALPEKGSYRRIRRHENIDGGCISLEFLDALLQCRTRVHHQDSIRDH